jgi:ABC-type amino acid transport substrate-binding protein
MKRILAILMAGLMLLSLTACDEKKDENVVKMGLLEAEGMEGLHTGAHDEHMRTSADVTTECISYNNLSSALMDLECGKIKVIGLEEYTARYIAARNENIIVGDTSDDFVKTNFSMLTLASNVEVYDILNNAIKAMKEDCTLDKLIENDLKAYIESDPEVKDLPHFGGAKTIKIGVTGDIPPMDFVAADGNAAGFNIALLAEIANRAQVNIELVQIETGARPMALSSGKVDAVFWTKSVTCGECNEEWAEVVEDTLVTESYFTTQTTVILKSDK